MVDRKPTSISHKCQSHTGFLCIIHMVDRKPTSISHKCQSHTGTPHARSRCVLAKALQQQQPDVQSKEHYRFCGHATLFCLVTQTGQLLPRPLRLLQSHVTLFCLVTQTGQALPRPLCLLQSLGSPLRTQTQRPWMSWVRGTMLSKAVGCHGGVALGILDQTSSYPGSMHLMVVGVRQFSAGTASHALSVRMHPPSFIGSAPQDAAGEAAVLCNKCKSREEAGSEEGWLYN